MNLAFEEIIRKYADKIKNVVAFDPVQDQLLPLDFTASNTELTDDILADTDRFSEWVTEKLHRHNAKYGIGGYNEHRTIYGRSSHFDLNEEPRRLHLGIDIWGPAETPVYNFYDAVVQSFAFNDNFGDYGATIILQYQLDGVTFFALYGHLSLASLQGLSKGQFIEAGKQFATFGVKEENGHWPPHLHFQLIFDLQGMEGDYPGVCQFSKRDFYLSNCPDPAAILRLTMESDHWNSVSNG
jgi:murein DD-endopeptidase MepM/ murein hydrolase activator NlpD